MSLCTVSQQHVAAALEPSASALSACPPRRTLPHPLTIDEHNVVRLEARLVAHVQRVDLVACGAHQNLPAARRPTEAFTSTDRRRPRVPSWRQQGLPSPLDCNRCACWRWAAAATWHTRPTDLAMCGSAVITTGTAPSLRHKLGPVRSVLCGAVQACHAASKQRCASRSKAGQGACQPRQSRHRSAERSPEAPEGAIPLAPALCRLHLALQHVCQVAQQPGGARAWGRDGPSSMGPKVSARGLLGPSIRCYCSGIHCK